MTLHGLLESIEIDIYDLVLLPNCAIISNAIKSMTSLHNRWNTTEPFEISRYEEAIRFYQIG